MDISTVLIKITGAILFIWTFYSIYKHVNEKRKVTRSKPKEEVQSISEQILNNILLYLWLCFMLTFSIGMIVNN